MNKQPRNKKAATRESKTASYNYHQYNTYKNKIKPAYYADYLCYPNCTLTLIAADWNTANLIHHLGTDFVLLCEAMTPEIYDLDFCFNKEVWVLYNGENYNRAIKLGHEIQRHGASKIILLEMNAKTLQENSYGKQ